MNRYQMITMSRGKITSTKNFKDMIEFWSFVTRTFHEPKTLVRKDSDVVLKCGDIPVNIIVAPIN